MCFQHQRPFVGLLRPPSLPPSLFSESPCRDPTLIARSSWKERTKPRRVLVLVERSLRRTFSFYCPHHRHHSFESRVAKLKIHSEACRFASHVSRVSWPPSLPPFLLFASPCRDPTLIAWSSWKQRTKPRRVLVLVERSLRRIFSCFVHFTGVTRSNHAPLRFTVTTVGPLCPVSLWC